MTSTCKRARDSLLNTGSLDCGAFELPRRFARDDNMWWSDDLVNLKYEIFVPAGLIPKRELYAVPEPQLVVDGAEIVFDDVFSGADFVGDFLVLESLSDEFD